MKIVIKDVRFERFDSLSVGDVFLFENFPYVKTEEITVGTNQTRNSLSLNLFKPHKFGPSVMVEPKPESYLMVQ